jgi:glycosyltransferase involved in cell wall biosynthesis
MPKFVSIIIPCRNEEKFVGKCLDSVLAHDYPSDQMEVLIADGMSTDNTRKILEGYTQRFPQVRWFDNPKKIVPTGLNILIRQAEGEIIVRLDAHNEYPKDYISKCVHALIEYKADNVGGLWITRPREASVLGKAIVFVLSHRFGVGNSLFRLGVKEPTEADTVPFGCYRREVFDRVGPFNENLVRNQDIEFKLRLKKAGGKILLLPDVVSYYYARSNLKDLAKNNFLNGFWVIYSMKFSEQPFSIRHLIPFGFVLSLIWFLVSALVSPVFFWGFVSALSLYLVFDLWVSLAIAVEKGFKYLPALLVSFLTLHLSYGIGSLCGLVKFFISEKK